MTLQKLPRVNILVLPDQMESSDRKGTAPLNFLNLERRKAEIGSFDAGLRRPTEER
jgi:hypothetical protein